MSALTAVSSRVPGLASSAGALLLAVACATNPVTGKRELAFMSEAQEIQIGQELDAEIRREMGVYDDPALQEYVEAIGLRLASNSERPHLPWHFTVVDVPAINAFALPGGYIYLTRGIMPFLDDEAELAGVLGHEIGHVTARHAVQQYTRATGTSLGLTLGSIFFPGVRPVAGLAETAFGVLFLKYGRDDELQADRLGAQYAARNEWDPAGVPSLLTTLDRIEEQSDRRGIPNWASTHPDPGNRVADIQPLVAELRAAATANLRTQRDDYLRRIDGLVFGDNPEEGIARGSSFLHPDLRFALTFPDGWEITNSKTQVVAKEPGRDIYMVLQLVEQPRGRTLEEVAVRGMRDAGYRQSEGGPTTINGLEAYVGTYTGSMQGLGRIISRAAHIRSDRNIYLLAGVVPEKLYVEVDQAIGESIRSFRALGREEAAEIRPNRIDVYVVRSGDTWQSIAQRAGESIVRPSTLAIMNHHPVNQQPEPGLRIKIVVAG